MMLEPTIGVFQVKLAVQVLLAAIALLISGADWVVAESGG